MLCAYLRLNKVIFCGYFTAKRGQCVFLSLSDCLSQTDDGYNTMVCVWNQSHDAWFPSHWQPIPLCYIRSKRRMAHRSWLQRRGRLQAHQPTYSCNCTMSHQDCLQNFTNLPFCGLFCFYFPSEILIDVCMCFCVNISLRACPIGESIVMREVEEGWSL